MRYVDRGEPAWERGVLTVFAALVVALMLGIVAQVLCSFLDINPIAEFNGSFPLVGDAITLNSLLDAQWHVLVIMALLPAWIVWRRDGHVRVDFLFSAMSPRGRALVELIGHIVFASPFLFLATPAAWSFMASAYRSGQGSTNDGLNDLFLIKAMLPIGLALLAIVMLIDVVRQLQKLVGR